MLQVCVINARAYEAAVNSAERLLADESCIDQCVLPTNKQVHLCDHMHQLHQHRLFTRTCKPCLYVL